MEISDFEEKILTCLCKKCIKPFDSMEEISEFCRKESCAFGVAVSGGADSVSLLISLSHILKNFNIPLKVISVNHFIRPDAETCGDAVFVENLCKKLKNQNYYVNFYLKELERGSVENLAKQRKMGTEEAARFLRYEAFEKFIHEEKILFLCLAHNKNDFYETVLMRFLQGSSCDSAYGISYTRDKFVRPLLDVQRSEIELYLKKLNQDWRTDKTNFDNSYLRNKIRGKLVPFLDENFDGWKTALDSGAKKAFDDSVFIGEYVDSIKIEKEFSDKSGNHNCFVDADVFFGVNNCIQIRLLLKMCNCVCDELRIPYKFLCDVCSAMEKKYRKYKDCQVNDGKSFDKYFGECRISFENNRIFVRKNETVIYDFCFSDIITSTGFFQYDWGSVTVKNHNSKSCNSGEDVDMELNYISGKVEKIKAVLPYQLIVNHR